MARTIEIKGIKRFQELIYQHTVLGDDTETRVLQLMGLGHERISEGPYRPNDWRDGYTQ